jgi:hypothetical protein
MSCLASRLGWYLQQLFAEYHVDMEYNRAALEKHIGPKPREAHCKEACLALLCRSDEDAVRRVLAVTRALCGEETTYQSLMVGVIDQLRDPEVLVVLRPTSPDHGPGTD